MEIIYIVYSQLSRQQPNWFSREPEKTWAALLKLWLRYLTQYLSKHGVIFSMSPITKQLISLLDQPPENLVHSFQMYSCTLVREQHKDPPQLMGFLPYKWPLLYYNSHSQCQLVSEYSKGLTPQHTQAPTYTHACTRTHTLKPLSVASDLDLPH